MPCINDRTGEECQASSADLFPLSILRRSIDLEIPRRFFCPNLLNFPCFFYRTVTVRPLNQLVVGFWGVRLGRSLEHGDR